MSVARIATAIAAQQGWTDTTLLGVVRGYIDNQQNDSTYVEYLREVAVAENLSEGIDEEISAPYDADGIIDAQGWSPDSVLALTLTYIENQQDDDAFADYLAGVAAEENVSDEWGAADDGEGSGLYDWSCAHCGEDLTESGNDRTGSRRCDDLDPAHRHHIPLGVEVPVDEDAQGVALAWTKAATEAVAAWEAALEGDSGDAEIEAGVRMADLLREMIEATTQATTQATNAITAHVEETVVVDGLALRLSFHPDAVREHFGGDEDYEAVIEAMSDEEVASLAERALTSDALYRTFHEVLVGALNESRNA